MFDLAQEDWIIGDPKKLKFDVLVHKAEMSGQCCLLSHNNTARQSTLPAMLSLIEIFKKNCIVHQCPGVPEGNQMVLTLAFWHAHESSERCKWHEFCFIANDMSITLINSSRLVCDQNLVLVSGTETKITRCLLFKCGFS